MLGGLRLVAEACPQTTATVCGVRWVDREFPWDAATTTREGSPICLKWPGIEVRRQES